MGIFFSVRAVRENEAAKELCIIKEDLMNHFKGKDFNSCSSEGHLKKLVFELKVCGNVTLQNEAGICNDKKLT